MEIEDKVRNILRSFKNNRVNEDEATKKLMKFM